MSNKKTILLVMTLMVLLLGISVVSAADISDNDTVTIADSPNTSIEKQESVSSDVIQDQSSVKTSQDTTSDVKSDKVITTDEITKNSKTLKSSPKTIVITNQTFKNYFDENGDLNTSLVSAGDTLDFQGTIIQSNCSMRINTPVNIISSTHDSNISLDTVSGSYFGNETGASFALFNGASYSNITGVYFYNTQLFIKNASHIKINNITAIVEDQRVGSGVGQTSIRENSSYIIVENSTFSTKNNGGSSTLVLAWASHCKINNNTLIGSGNVGNLLYLTTYNVDGISENDTINDYNILSNNTIYGREEVESICYGITICGKNNQILNNTIYYNGTGITSQWVTGETEQSINNTVIGNTLVGCNLYAPVNGTVVNNTLSGVNGVIIPTEGAIIENNTAVGLTITKQNSIVGNNTINGNVTFNSIDVNNTLLENLTINGNVILQAGTSSYNTPSDITIQNNTINGNIILNGTNRTEIKNNNISGQVLMGYKANRNNYINITNNSIITDGEYAVSIDKTSKDILIADNYLEGDYLGDESVYIKTEKTEATVENNRPCNTTINLTSAYGLIKEKIIINATVTNTKGVAVQYGQVTFTDSNKKNWGTVNVTDGIASVELTYTTVGSRTITAKYSSSEYYSSNATSTVVIDKINIKTTGNLVYNIASPITINVTNSSNSAVKNGTLEVVAGGKTQSLTFKNGVATFNYTPDSMSNVLVKTTYTSPTGVIVTNSTTLKVNKANTTVTVEPVNGLVNEVITITAEVLDQENKTVNTGKVTFKDSNSGKTLGTATVSDGIATVTTRYTTLGVKNITATYAGSTTYNSATTTSKITVCDVAILFDGDLTYNVTSPITISVIDSDKNPVTMGTLSVKVNGATQSVSFKNGVATFNYRPTSANDVNVTATHNSGDSKVTNSTLLPVAKLNTTVKASAITGTVNKTLTLKATVTNQLSKNVNEGKVSFIFNGTTLATTTVSNGVATATTSFNVSGTKTITANYTDAASHNPSSTTFKATIYRLNTTTTAKANNAAINQTVTINATVKDSNNKAVGEGTVTFTESGKTLGTSKVSNGIATLNTKFNTTGTKTITATYKISPAYNTSSTTAKVIISKLATKVNSTAVTTVINNSTTIKVSVYDSNNKAVNEGNVRFTLGSTTLGTSTVSKGVATISTKFATAGTKTITATYIATTNYNTSYTNIKVTVDKLDTTTKIKATPVTTEVNQSVTLTATVTDELSNAVTSGSVKFTLGNTTLGTAKVSKGVATLTTKFATAGTNAVTVTYVNSSAYKASSNNINIMIDQLQTTNTISTVKGVIGNQFTLTAKVMDEYNNPVINGYVIFKLNGITIKDNKKLTGSTGMLKVNVVNGIATVNITADLDMRHAKNLTSVYAGSSSYVASRSNAATVEIALRNASISVKTSTKVTKQGQNITLTATVKDILRNNTNLESYEDQYVFFKINGITLKDANGKTVQAKIVNGVATANYTIPLALSGVTDCKTMTPRNHTVTAGFVNPNYYPTARANNTFQVERSNITINFENVTINNKTHKMAIKANIKDYLGNYVKGPNKYIIKVNGATLKNGTKTLYFQANNGIINIKDITVPTQNNYSRIEIVTQDRLGYKNQRNTTTTINVIS